MVKSAIEGFARGCMLAWPRWNLPPLYASGVRFELPSDHGSGDEYFQLPPYTYAAKKGDCDKLVIWRLCELWHASYPASCRTLWVGERMHVLVRHSTDDSGPEEDPSILLGARAV